MYVAFYDKRTGGLVFEGNSGIVVPRVGDTVCLRQDRELISSHAVSAVSFEYDAASGILQGARVLLKRLPVNKRRRRAS